MQNLAQKSNEKRIELFLKKETKQTMVELIGDPM